MTAKNDKDKPKKNVKPGETGPGRGFRLSLLGIGLVALAYVVTIAALLLR